MPPDNFNFRSMADIGPEHYGGVELDDDDDEIGLPIMHNVTDDDDEEIGLELPSVNVARDLADRQNDDDATETGFEEFDNLAEPPQNQADGLTMRTQYGEVNFQTFMEELIFTLASKYTGYTELNELRNDLGRDAGFSPDLVVQHFGFSSLAALMNSDRVRNYVQVIPIEGKMCYLPRDFSRFSHIRDAQEITQNVTMLHMEEEERDKFARSLLPQNRDTAIRGRQAISKILYELGGEHRPINWQDIQKKYKQDHDVELAGQELKRMFQRDKALSIIHTLFEKEVTTFQGSQAGHFFLQFKMPYHELVEYYEEQLRTHSEAEAYLRQIRSNNSKNVATVRHNKAVYPTGPMQLQGNPAVDRFLEQGPSTSAAAGIPPNPRPTSNGPIQSANSAAPSNTVLQNQSNWPPQPPSAVSNSQTKSKFVMPDLNLTRANPSLTERLAMMNDSVQDANAMDTNSPNKFRFTENDVEAYSGPAEAGNGPRNEANASGGSGMNTSHQPASTKQPKYTKPVDPGDMTDSEAEEDDGDEDDAASVAIAPGGTRPAVRASQESTMPAFNLPPSNGPIQQNGAFGNDQNANANNNGNAFSGIIPPTSTSCHQKAILNHMMEKANKKKAEANSNGIGRSTPAILQRTPTPPPMRQAPQQQKNVAFNPSEDEEEEEDLLPNKQAARNQPIGNQNNSNSMNAAFSSSVPQFRPNQQQFATIPNASISSNQIHQIGTRLMRDVSANANNNGMGGGHFQQSNSSLLRPSFSTRPNQSMHGESVADWQLMDHVSALSALASRMHLHFEIRGDEGSVIFRNGSPMILVLSECNVQIRVSKHSNGYIHSERYYDKVDWEMFHQALLGIAFQTFVDETGTLPLPRKMFEGEAEADDSCGWGCEPNNSRSRRCTSWGDYSGICGQNRQLATALDESSYQWDESDGWGQPSAAADADINSFPYGQPPTTSNNINVNTIPGHMTMTMDNIGPQIPPQMQQYGCPPTQEAVANYDEHASVPMQRNVRHYLLEKVPSQFESSEPPNPAYCKTVDGRDFLAFFTKIYGFSNHYSTPFEIDGVNYCCSEQYYMYMKTSHFGFNAAAEEIMATTSSAKIKELGTADTLRMRQACGLEPGAGIFDHDEWKGIKPKVMMAALQAKFRQNAFLFNMLIQTGSAYLVEASASDVFWGIGCALNSDRIRDPSQWRGENVLGLLLMRLRRELQSQFPDFDRKWKRPRSATTMTHQQRQNNCYN